MPSIKLCSFASGSTGNCTLIATDTTRILVDAGISAARINKHLGELGLAIDDLDGVCVTHEHSDHIKGLPTLQKKTGVGLYGNAGTAESILQKRDCAALRWNIFKNGQGFDIGDLSIESYSIPHDAYDPVGFIIRWKNIQIAMATDIGLPTSLVRERLRGSNVIVLETNHDEDLVQSSPRPWALKQRILGRQGHLSNENAARMVAEIACPKLERVYLAHLSQDCNRPELALGTTKRVFKDAGLGHVELELTYPSAPAAVWEKSLHVPATT